MGTTQMNTLIKNFVNTLRVSMKSQKLTETRSLVSAVPSSNTSPDSQKNVFASSYDEEQLRFCKQGEETTLFLPNGSRLRHGTSPALIQRASRLIQRDFEMNADKDMRRYHKKNKYPYYSIIESPASHQSGFRVDCAIRTILDDLVHPTTVLVDFIRSDSKAKGKGTGSLLVTFVLEGCKALDADVYVTSTKEALTFWKRFGFVLESNEDIDDDLNEFKDCTLLKLATNKAERYQFSSDTCSSYDSDSSYDSSTEDSADSSTDTSDDSSTDSSEDSSSDW